MISRKCYKCGRNVGYYPRYTRNLAFKPVCQQCDKDDNEYNGVL